MERSDPLSRRRSLRSPADYKPMWDTHLRTHDLRSRRSVSWLAPTNQDPGQIFPWTSRCVCDHRYFFLSHFKLFSVCYLLDVNMFWFSLRAMTGPSIEGIGPTEVLLTSGCRASPVGGWNRGLAEMANHPPPGSSALFWSSQSCLCWWALTGPADTEPRLPARWAWTGFNTVAAIGYKLAG